jgi:hypothetical protein
MARDGLEKVPVKEDMSVFTTDIVATVRKPEL